MEKRHEQDSNLCGETPLDFESNALTSRPPWRYLPDSYQAAILLTTTVWLLKTYTDSNFREW